MTQNTPSRLPFPASASRPVTSPLMPSVAYATPDPDALDAIYEGAAPGWTYAREGHPNAAQTARMIDALEGAEGGFLTGSGMAAISAVLFGAVKAGEHILGGDQLYGRSLRLLTQDLPRLGIAASLFDPTDARDFEARLRPETKLVLIEVVSNPTIRIADFEPIARISRERGILLAVDNTFTTPAGFNPLQRGADIVIHSVTKILSGHSDATLGYVAAKDPALGQHLAEFAKTLGLTASPFDAWLAERGLLTYALRYAAAEANAAALADHLAELAGVKRVLYPTRADHPDHNRAAALLGARGGHMVSFEIEGGRAAANALCRAAEGISFAPTLGDVSTTLSQPVSASHRAVPPEALKKVGISEGFFRISVGIEPIEALKSAFGKAIEAARAAR